MKECSKCYQVLDFDEFGRQRADPSKFYKWCRSCRRTAESVYVGIDNAAYHAKVRADMKQKAIQSRKFNEEQVKLLRKRRKEGATFTALATEFGSSTSAVANAIRGYR